METAAIPDEARRLLTECAAVVDDKVDPVDFLRFAYYYALRRQERESQAHTWLNANRPDVAERLAHPPPAEEAAPPPSPEALSSSSEPLDPIQAAIALTDNASRIQARVRGRVSRRRAAERADDPGADGDRASSMWTLAVAETKRKKLRELQMEVEMLKRNEAIATTRLQEENARLDREREVARLQSEVTRLQAAQQQQQAEQPAITVEERIAALNWLVRSKSKAES